MFSDFPLHKWILVILFIGIQCKAVDTSQQQDAQLKKLVEENIGTDYNKVFNESKMFALYIQNIPAAKIGTTYVNFIVVELKNNRLAEKGKFLYGHCVWLDPSSLEVVDMPGALKENQQPSEFKRIIVIKESKTQRP